MGYDSRLYIVKKYPRYNENGELNEAIITDEKIFAETIATFELCVFPPIHNYFHGAGNPSRNADCYVYGKDGETKLLNDAYGDPLKEATLDEIIHCLENLTDKHKTYRRVLPLLGMLRGFQETRREWGEGEELAVLHYGH